MLPQSTLEDVQSLDIVDVIGKYVKLQKKGSSFLGSCPFHNEKSASFNVHQSKHFFKCFGCGEKGDAISFVMKHEKLSFVDSVLLIARDHNIPVPEEKFTAEQQEHNRHLENLRLTNKLVNEYFVANLYLPENSKALEYVRSRWDDEIIADFQLGFAPDGWHTLQNYARANGFNESLLLEAGLLSFSKDRTFDYFRNRIIFPITDETNRIIGFTGRDFSGKPESPKYFNSPETILYKKGKSLYGIGKAKYQAKETGSFYLVEGNADVIKMHHLGLVNTVATGGTALTDDQIRLIKKYATSVTIIGDTDKAGKIAVERSGELLIKAGVFVHLLTLPTEENRKHDPDSFFISREQFDEFEAANKTDFIISYVTRNKALKDDAHMFSKIVDHTCTLISSLPESTHEVYIDQVSKLMKPRKIWQDGMKALKKETEPEKQRSSFIPEHVNLEEYNKYGFYADKNCYHFNTNKGIVKGSNFIMEPLFHIASVLNAKRLYRITNEYNFSQVIEVPQKDLISLAAFKLRVESLGNFLFSASDNELGKLKAYLYDKTKTCYEIAQLGWQKQQGFFAWSNGIFNGKYTPVDSNGIVKFHEENYYLPAHSSIYQNESSLFINERRFRYSEGTVTLHKYASQLIAVFGDPALFGICFYMATLFRDHIVSHFGFFPILNLFGPKGAGKTELAISLMQFFGNQAKGPNLTNTTKAALADHVAMFSNACCHIDEYKNNVEYEKIEFLKGLWDGTGRTRMNMDKDRKKETTNVDCGTILSGQEMTTADIALYTRLIFLGFTKVEYTDAEKTAFNELKAIEKTGLTHITHEILSHRAHFIKHFIEDYTVVSDIMSGILGNTIIEDRIFRNWLIILAAYKTLSGKINLPIDSDAFYKKAAGLIIRQNSETKKGNEVSIFWKIVEYLAIDQLINEEVDFKIIATPRFKTDKADFEWNTPKTVLLLNHSRVFQLYRVHGNKTKDNVLPLKTLEYYLQNSKEYLGCKKSVAFKVEENGRIDDSVQTGFGKEGTVKRRITTAFAFDYDLLDINISTSFETVSADLKNDLPF
jgi:DNA primase catalytic core